MSELCISKCHFSSLVDFILFCSFILSHPLYFSYFIFFSPYLLKLISFLSPLFLTTFLLSLAFLAGFESSQTLFTSILQRLQFKKDHCPNEEDDLGIYEIVFGPPLMAAVTEEDPSQILDRTQQKDYILEPNPLPGSEMEDHIVAKAEDLEESKVSLSSKSEIPCAVVMEEKRLENFLKILDEFERLTSNVEEKKKKKKTKSQEPPRGGAKSNKVVEKQKSLFMFMNVGSEAAACNNNNENQTNDPTKLESSTMAKSQSQRVITADDGDREDLSSYGSMRREREWKRTLACKLFEERHNAAAVGGGGGEAMDSLWEAYEVDSEKLNKRKSEKAKKKMEREWEEDDEAGGAQLCCLQALKLSAGKMNLGVGKPNLVKISKAIKGIGWLHNLTKNSKKVHNNGDHRY